MGGRSPLNLALAAARGELSLAQRVWIAVEKIAFRADHPGGVALRYRSLRPPQRALETAAAPVLALASAQAPARAVGGWPWPWEQSRWVVQTSSATSECPFSEVLASYGDPSK